jgi:hypothetical protein
VSDGDHGEYDCDYDNVVPVVKAMIMVFVVM